MSRILALTLFLLSVSHPSYLCSQEPLAGSWNCQLDCPGGALKFGLIIEQQPNEKSLRAYLTNGSEKISIPSVEQTDQTTELRIDHYDSSVAFKQRGTVLQGRWKKRRGEDKWVEMKFSGTKKQGNDSPTSDSVEITWATGKWLVDFEKSDDPAVAIFRSEKNGTASGTFLTTTGDYRFLHGTANQKTIELSCFDGAHAFLFRAELNDAGKLEGDFWSSDTWHEKWTAIRKDDATLPDAFKQTTLVGQHPLENFKFPDMNGEPTSLVDSQFAAKARLIYVFGSWCPNCHDAAAYFKKLQEKYGSDLSILGLAFEHTGDFERDSAQVSKYLKRHQVSYPVLLAGLSDKQLAGKSIPFLDRVRSYPTTIFLNGENNQVQEIHTGFTGPATGKAYLQMTEKFERIIDGIIAEK